MGEIKMRLRRLEIIIIGLTLAFALFMGGFFTGRNWSTINIVPVQSSVGQHQSTGNVTIQTPATPQPVITTNSQEESNNGTLLPVAIETPDGTPLSENPANIVGMPASGDGRININLASQSELTDLPGIGSVLASRIIDYRRLNGNFQRIEDIRNVSGIGEKRYEAIQDKITVGR